MDDSVLSRSQLRAWLSCQLVGDPAAHVSPLCYDVPAELDRPALERALRHIVDRHDVLRTRIFVERGEPVRVVDPPGRFRLAVDDLRAEPDPIATARGLVADFAERGIDPVAGPVFQALLLRVGPARQVLAIVAHSIAWDSTSHRIFEEELSDGYTEYLAGRRPDVSILRFAEVAAAERAGTSADRTLAHWRARLEDAPDLLGLPVDRPRPPVRTLRAGEMGFEISAEISHRLEEFARSEGASLFEVGLAAYQALLARYCGTSDVVVGVPGPGRAEPPWSRLIGPLTNPVAIRTAIAGDPSFRELLHQVRDEVAAAATASVPFDQVVGELGRRRDLSRHPVFQAWFESQAEEKPLRLADVEATRFGTGTERMPVDLSLRLRRHESGAVTGVLGYAVDLFDRGTMNRFADHYLNFLFSVAAQPARSLSRVEIFFAGEWDELIHTVNRTSEPLPPYRTVIAWFEAQTASSPDAPALVSGALSLTYAQLNARANQLAHYLRGRGARVGTVVAVCLPRDVEMVVAVLAVFKTGAAYVPVDPGQPTARIAYYLGDAGACLLVTHSTLVGGLPAERPETVVLDRVSDETDAAPADDSEPAATADDLAYIIYTSGSTGRPKGVAMPHRPLLNLIAWQVRWSAAPGPTWQFASLSFDPSFKELFGTLLGGETVVLVGDEQRTDPDELLTLLRRHEVRRMLFCPPMVLEVLALSAVPLDEQPPLREITTGGDRLQLSVTTKKWLAELPGLSLTNGYGLTETHLIAAARLTGEVDGWPESPTLGTPLSNVRIYLLDSYLRPVPVGAVGEIFVGGLCVSWGYLGRSASTAERFLPDPYSDLPGARLYRSGDLARRRADGTLEFFGRADHQVKVRGHRIEPAEIEAVLMAYRPAPRAALVVPVERGGDVRLAAYVVPGAGPTPGIAEIRAYLRATLPAHLRPAHVVLLPALPLTGRGKVDRSRLPAPPERTGTRHAPTPEQAVVAGIWQEILGVPDVGPEDNFFELGGHSMLVMRVCHALAERFGVRVTPKSLFENQTVREVAAFVSTSTRSY